MSLSIGLIVGGLSGEMVLRGTDSSLALVGVGFLWLIYDLYNIAAYMKQRKKSVEINPTESARKANKKKYDSIPIVIASVIWMILTIICFILSYDEYEYRIHTLPALLSLIISTILVLTGCAMVMAKRKKGIVIAFIGGILNIIWGLVFESFYYGARGYEQFHADEFIIYAALILLPGLVLLLLMFRKQNNKFVQH